MYYTLRRVKHRTAWLFMRDRRAGKESANMGLYLNPGNETFAELGSDIKNKISHRALAINKLCEFLHSL